DTLARSWLRGTGDPLPTRPDRSRPLSTQGEGFRHRRRVDRCRCRSARGSRGRLGIARSRRALVPVPRRDSGLSHLPTAARRWLRESTDAPTATLHCGQTSDDPRGGEPCESLTEKARDMSGPTGTCTWCGVAVTWVSIYLFWRGTTD